MRQVYPDIGPMPLFPGQPVTIDYPPRLSGPDQTVEAARGERYFPIQLAKPRGPRERWHYVGTGIIDGQKCYLWKRYDVEEITDDERASGKRQFSSRMQGYAHPVSTFWPKSWKAGEVPPCDTYLSGCPSLRQLRCVAADRCTGEDEVMG